MTEAIDPLDDLADVLDPLRDLGWMAEVEGTRLILRHDLLGDVELDLQDRGLRRILAGPTFLAPDLVAALRAAPTGRPGDHEVVQSVFRLCGWSIPRDHLATALLGVLADSDRVSPEIYEWIHEHRSGVARWFRVPSDTPDDR